MNSTSQVNLVSQGAKNVLEQECRKEWIHEEKTIPTSSFTTDGKQQEVVRVMFLEDLLCSVMAMDDCKLLTCVHVVI
eukprot:6303117-Amphidinium_carterae.1